jgi:hypothetical protein
VGTPQAKPEERCLGRPSWNAIGRGLSDRVRVAQVSQTKNKRFSRNARPGHRGERTGRGGLRRQTIGNGGCASKAVGCLVVGVVRWAVGCGWFVAWLGRRTIVAWLVGAGDGLHKSIAHRPRFYMSPLPRCLLHSLQVLTSAASLPQSATALSLLQVFVFSSHKTAHTPSLLAPKGPSHCI